MAGSTMIFEADSLQDVQSWVEEDLYYTSNVVCRSFGLRHTSSTDDDATGD